MLKKRTYSKRKKASRRRATSATSRSLLAATGGGAASPPWPDRRAALDGFMTRLEQRLSTCAFPRFETLLCLVQRLHVFGNQHFDDFDNGLGDATKYFPDLRNYPPETIFAPIIRQISHDLDLITEIVGQRDTGGCSAFDGDQGDEQVTLRNADKLANLALQSAVTARLLSNDLTSESLTAVSYFQKAPSVRVIPYAPAALVGVPLTTLRVPTDFLAIPHEVGHYVYWHGKAGNIVIRQELETFSANPQNVPIWVYNWREEIFADVFGCVIASVKIANDFQEREFQRAGHKFIADDGEHPVSAIRPYIYTKTLKLMGENAAAIQLESDWFVKLQQRNVNPNDVFIPANPLPDIALTFQDARREAEKLVEHIHTTWLTDLRCQWPQGLQGTPQQVAAQLNGVAAPGDLDPATNITNLYTDWRAYEPVKNDPSRPTNQPPFPPDSWRGLVFANGWTTEGANGGFNP